MRIGTRLLSQACDGEVVIVRAEGAETPLDAGGVPMVESRTDERAGETDGEGFALGKRYELHDEAVGVRLEVLVTRPGTSTLSWQGRALTLRATKPLPASD